MYRSLIAIVLVAMSPLTLHAHDEEQASFGVFCGFDGGLAIAEIENFGAALKLTSDVQLCWINAGDRCFYRWELAAKGDEIKENATWRMDLDNVPTQAVRCSVKVSAELLPEES